jgi:glycosyltransferase involved in cell wall biosynthesis
LIESCIQNRQFALREKGETNKEDSSGILDGITIFRFAHMWRNASSGGVETYLSNLNRHLLKRNKMQILQMYLLPDGKSLDIEVEHIGLGELIWIPSLFKMDIGPQTKAQRLWTKLRPAESHKIQISHDFLLSILDNYRINLAVFHWISEDSKICLNYLNKRQVPFAVVNHFQNARLKRRRIRRQISEASAIGGVSSVDVPGFLRDRFTNLSDGVDTEFFHPGKAILFKKKIEEPLILLPSRITEGKGHLDAIKALSWLSLKGISAFLAFAGRMGSQVFMEKLQRIISKEGLQERVIFAGQLGPEELRNWYAASSLVVLPSYSEGFGKVLLEAQAMQRPAVAYDVGGVAEAIRHGDGGFLVRAGDIEGLAIFIKKLIEDRDKRSEMGERGRNFVTERFSLYSLIIRHERFYANILNKSTLR